MTIDQQMTHGLLGGRAEESESERERARVRASERERERERESERESECVCVCERERPEASRRVTPRMALSSHVVLRRPV